MKKLKLIFLSCLATLLCLGFAGCKGCGCDGESGTGSSRPKVEQEVEPLSITLDKTSLLMTIGDEVRLIATVTGIGEAIDYDSDDKSIATVDEYGLITAISEGKTVIRAKYGEATHSCEVTVSLNGMRPSLEFKQIVGDCVTVAVGDILNLESRVFFNGKYFEDVKVDYTYSDPLVGSVTDENVFTPLKAGETSVGIRATWRGIQDEITLTKQITIKVQNDVALYVNDGATEYTLYTLSELQGKTYPTSMNFQPTAKVNGQDIECTATVKEGANIVNFTENTVTALSYGKAVITLDARDGEDSYEKDVIINVLRPVGVYAETVEYFSALDGELPISSIFGKTTTIVNAEQDGKTLTVEENKVLGVETNRDSVKDTKIIVYDEDTGYEVNLRAYTKIIDDAEDLQALASTTLNPVVDGYFYVVDDIISAVEENFHTGYWPNVSNKTVNGSCGFKGVLEGNGHTISYVFNEVGLLGNLLDGAIVKNVALIATRNVENLTTLTPCVLAHNSGLNVKVENVYARVVNNVSDSARNIVFIGTRSSSLELNCVIVENDTLSLTNRGGVLFYADSARKDSGQQGKLRNVYALSSYPFMCRWETAKCIYANNDTAEADYTTEDKTITNYTGVMRYDSYATMKQKGVAYDDFNQSFWNVSLGVPVWKGLFTDYAKNASVFLGETDTASGAMTLEVGTSKSLLVSLLGEQISYTCNIIEGEEYVSYSEGKLSAVAYGDATVKVSYIVDGNAYERSFALATTLSTETYSQTIEFSALDGDLPLEDIFGENVTLVKAYQGTNELTVSDNKVFGVQTNRDGVTVTQISVFTADKGYLLNLDAYTKILDGADDFKVFDLTDSKVIDGYYYLKNDVNLAEAYSHTAYWKVASGKISFVEDVGFNGVFEGNGHTISYPFNEWGLFGQLLDDATIKNVCFVATRNAEESSVATQTGAIARSAYGGEITNVYVKIIDSLSNANRNASLIGYRYYSKNSYGYTVLTDVIVEALNSDATLRGGVLFDSDGARTQGENLQDKNVYVISGHQCMARWSAKDAENICFASNDSYTASGTVIKYSYVTRYDGVNALEAVVEKVGTWTIKDGMISWIA